MAAIQDKLTSMPQTIHFKRHLPNRGPSGAALFVGVFGVMAYGWYWVAQSNWERRY